MTRSFATILITAALAACSSGPPVPPGQCFSTPGPIGCCGPLAKATGDLGGIGTYGCTNGRQQVYQAKFGCGDDNACRSGKYTTTVNGRTMGPTSCSGGFALFAIDDPSCPASW